MLTILVTGSDTGVGKTQVVAALARVLASGGAGGPGAGRPRLQIVKVVETGRTDAAIELGDAERARQLSATDAEAITLASFPEPIAPAAAAAAVGQTLSCEMLVAAARDLRDCDWRIYEGAGGVATPIDDEGRDWSDFAKAAGVDAVIVVVPDRLGAINQARLALARAREAGVPVGVWLNATATVDPVVARSTRAGLRAADVPVWAEQALDAVAPRDPGACLQAILAAVAESAGEGSSPKESRATSRPGAESAPQTSLIARCRAALEERDGRSLRRTLRVAPRDPSVLDLSGNDYLALAHDPAMADAVAAAARTYGTSASASPLISGWTELHEQCTQRLCAWHGFPSGLLWSSGYAANSAVLGGLPARGDLVLADRLIHHSMIAGLLRSGARLQRYEHVNLDRLEEGLHRAGGDARQVFVVTESLFSMDGDFPDLRRMAALRERFGFCWIVDEAHATGWYGPAGAGLVRAAGVEEAVDVLVGTFGKALGSGGAYTLFRDATVRDYLVNTAGEFIYSTALPPTTVAAAIAALDRMIALSAEQPAWHESSRSFRRRLQQEHWSVPAGDSPIIPVVLDDPAAAVSAAEALRIDGILAGAVRPPTVPAGTSRLRFSLRRDFRATDAERVLAALARWRAAQ